MHNRIVTLFDLDELLGTATTRPRAAVRKSGRQPTSRPGAKPRSGQVTAQAFDRGDPITLRHGDADARSVSRPTPPAPEFVGSFADEDRRRTEAAEPEAEEEELAELGTGENEDEEAERTTEDTEAQSYRPPHSPSHAAQVAAFEREVQALAAKRPPESPPSGARVEDAAPPDEGANQAPPPQPGGHQVFDRMAEGMTYANEFRLPPVEVKRLFRELDEQIDTQARRARARAQETPFAAALELPSVDVLAQDLARLSAPPVDSEQAANVLAEQLGTGQLQHFAPEELQLDEAETLAVFAFFWPETDFSTLRPITDQDRSFAQALLIAAADASHSMGMVETIWRTFFMKVPKGFASIRNALLKLAKKAIDDGWFKKIKTVAQAEKVQIYESVRATLQRNFHTVVKLRTTTGELTGY